MKELIEELYLKRKIDSVCLILLTNQRTLQHNSAFTHSCAHSYTAGRGYRFCNGCFRLILILNNRDGSIGSKKDLLLVLS